MSPTIWIVPFMLRNKRSSATGSIGLAAIFSFMTHSHFVMVARRGERSAYTLERSLRVFFA